MKKIKTTPLAPQEFEVEQISENEANIMAYPFETGYAISLAHPLRRFLLSSSVGYAPIAIKIEGAKHRPPEPEEVRPLCAVCLKTFQILY